MTVTPPRSTLVPISHLSQVHSQPLFHLSRIVPRKGTTSGACPAVPRRASARSDATPRADATPPDVARSTLTPVGAGGGREVPREVVLVTKGPVHLMFPEFFSWDKTYDGY